MIGVGGVAYLSCENKIFGSLLFSIGLLTILYFGFNLFTGAIGYLLDKGVRYVFNLLICLVGNFIGTYIVSVLIKNTRYILKLSNVNNIVLDKMNDSTISVFILGIMCGLLMYIAVNTFKTKSYGFVVTILCVMGFITCGFEHSIANMFYMNMTNAFDINGILKCFTMIIGNSVGGLLIPSCDKLTEGKF